MICPYEKRSCHTLDLENDLHADAGGWLHRHDHRNCRPTMRVESRLDNWRWQHPLDEEGEYHEEPILYMSARDPLQKHYPAPWQVVATSLMLCKTSRRQAEMVATALFHHVKGPRALVSNEYGVRLDLEGILRPLGLVSNRVRYLRELGDKWPIHAAGPPEASFVAGLLGCGQYVIDAYRIFVLHELIPSQEVTDRVLRLHLEMRYPRRI